MDYSSQTNKNQSEDRLDVFASVQFDPEVWELVQKKYNHFEDLHHKLEGLQSERRDLLSQLSKVNASISDLQDQIVSLSGKEVEDNQASEAIDVVEAASVMPEPAKVENEENEVEPVVGLAPLETEAAEEDEPANESSVAWPGVETAALAAAGDAPEDEEKAAPLAAEATEAYQPAVAESEPVKAVPAEFSVPAVMPAQVSFAQPIKETQPESVETPVAAPITVEPAAEVETPAEVRELQHLFDAADDQRRQSDSALKLVQLYDGKADVFFAAMCRSHQQSGLDENEARHEAIKDVQTMITTAKNHATSSPVDAKKNQNGGMRRLFSH